MIRRVARQGAKIIISIADFAAIVIITANIFKEEVCKRLKFPPCI